MAEPATRYTRLAMFLHWLVAILIAINLILVWTVDLLPQSYSRLFINNHKSIGITVLGLALLRLLWRAANPPPPLLAGTPTYQRHAAHAAHLVLYVLIFTLPLTGWMHDSAWKDAAANPMRLFDLIPWPRIGLIENLDPQTKEQFHAVLYQVHGSLALVLYGLVTIHILGALKHQFIDKQPELQRMWPSRR